MPVSKFTVGGVLQLLFLYINESQATQTGSDSKNPLASGRLLHEGISACPEIVSEISEFMFSYEFDLAFFNGVYVE